MSEVEVHVIRAVLPEVLRPNMFLEECPDCEGKSYIGVNPAWQRWRAVLDRLAWVASAMVALMTEGAACTDQVAAADALLQLHWANEPEQQYLPCPGACAGRGKIANANGRDLIEAHRVLPGLRSITPA